MTLFIVFCVARCTNNLAADLHVDPIQGDDSANGYERPVKSLAVAIRLASPGDTIHLLPDTTYYDWAAFPADNRRMPS